MGCMPSLLEASQVPEYRRLDYVYKGYRYYAPHSKKTDDLKEFNNSGIHFPFGLCLRSILHIHNESGNIWTHMLAFYFFLWKSYEWYQKFVEDESASKYSYDTRITMAVYLTCVSFSFFGKCWLPLLQCHVI